MTVVESNAEDLGRDDRGKQSGHLGRFTGVSPCTEEIAFDLGYAAVGLFEAGVNLPGGVGVSDDLHVRVDCSG